MKSMIFFGAGASKSEGAPLQDELFSAYFNECSKDKDRYYNVLQDFFMKAYNLDVRDTKVFPTFEEILGLLYSAEKRRESFYFNTEEIKEGIIFSMAEILDRKFLKGSTYHNQLIEKLKKEELLMDVIFITTNYDLLLDSAILSNGLDIDYGFKNIYKHQSECLPLYKIFGSLNWKYCDVCDNFLISSQIEDGMLKSIIKEDYACNICHNQFKSIIVPPTFYKEISNYYLNNIYHNLNKGLYEVENIIFCGYSFPDADLYIKFILKRAELYKDKPFNIIIINNYEGKLPEKIEKEKDKYKLFFNGNIHYTNHSFQDFCKEPERFIPH
ncbi:SIR2 family protein [Alkalibaculum bacchi]|uniref:SIR2 family protein n=1 Tax=Alkalibaculum bacchi TaxID=645887 RepID=UPI0026EAC2E3|nr:SIR2 family protein [Alkalibaculum bacchi]